MMEVRKLYPAQTVGEAIRFLEAARAQSWNIIAARKEAGLEPCSPAHRQALEDLEQLIVELSERD